MPTKFQLRRGLSSANDALVGGEGELTYDTEAKQLRVHDGVTAGGTKVAKHSDIPFTAILSNDIDNAIKIMQNDYDALFDTNPRTLYLVLEMLSRIKYDVGEGVTYAFVGSLTSV